MFGRYAIFKSENDDSDTTILSSFMKKVKRSEQHRSVKETQRNRELLSEYENRFSDLLKAFANMKSFCKIIEDVKKFTDSYDYIEYRNCKGDYHCIYKPEFEIKPYYSDAEKERLNPKDNSEYCYDITAVFPDEIRSKLKHISVPMVYMKEDLFFCKSFKAKSIEDFSYTDKIFTGPFKFIDAVNDNGTLNDKVFEYQNSARQLGLHGGIHVHSDVSVYCDIKLPFDEGNWDIGTGNTFMIVWFAFFHKYLQESFKLYGTAILWDSVLNKFYTLKR